MLNDRLKALRLELGLTQEEIGKKLNKTKNNISQYETGKREPDIETLQKLANLFSVSLDYLLGQTNEKEAKKSSMPEIPKQFNNPQEAREYVNKHQIFGANGFRPERMSDEEILEFANALLDQMELLSYKYKK